MARGPARVEETRSNGYEIAYTTHLVDLDRGLLIRSFPGRNKAVLAAALESMPDWWRAGIRVVTIDAYAPYAAALRAVLPDALQVLDKFHVVRLLAQAVDDVRRRVRRQTHSGRRGRVTDRLWRGRRTILKREDRLDERGRTRLQAIIEDEDANGHVEAAWRAYQGLFTLLDRKGTTGLRTAMNEWFELLAVDVPELTLSLDPPIGGSACRVAA